MRVCQILVVALALSASGCASWHRPSLVFRGRASAPAEDIADEIIVSRPGRLTKSIDLDATGARDETSPEDDETLTPPIEGTTHRHKYRPSRNDAPREVEQQLRDRLPVNPPSSGYIELPPPPEEGQARSPTVKG
jgi:hypothetical protein